MSLSILPTLSPAVILDLVASLTLQRQEGRAGVAIMQAMAAQVREMLQADRVRIYQVCPQPVGATADALVRDALVRAEALAAEGVQAGPEVKDPLLGADWWPHYQRRQGVALADEVENILSPEDLAHWRALHLQSALAVPMVRAGDVAGLWVVHSLRPRVWLPLEIQLLEHLALHSLDLLPWPDSSSEAESPHTPTPRSSSPCASTLEETQEATRQAENRWKAALEGAGAGVWDWDMETNRVFYSRQWKAVLGYGEATVGEDFTEWDSRVHPEDKARTYAALEAHIQGYTPTYQSEHRLRCQDGSYKWMLDRGQIIEWTWDGKPRRMIGINQDITDHKRIEAALRQSEEALRESRNKYQTLFETLPLGVAITDAQGRIVEVNPASEQLLGLSMQEQTARTYDAPNWQIIRPDGSPMPPAEFASVRALQENRFIHNVEMGIVKAQGEVTWISVSAAPIPLAQYGVAVCYVDLTARRQLEQSLALANVSLEQLGVAALWVNREGRICRANGPACTSLGYSRDELIQQPVDRIAPGLAQPDWPSFWETVQRQTVQEHEQHLTIQTYHRTRQGTEFPVEAMVRHLQFRGEAYVFVLARDVRERQRTETQLRLQSAALEACADGVVITDVQGRVQWVNPAFTTITQFTLAEAKGKNPRDLVKSGQHPPGFYQDLWKTILAGQCWRGEIINRRKDGSLYHEFSTITPVFNERCEIQYFVAIKQDISERKAIELALRQQSERERMIQVITHRIRQSLHLDEILGTTVAEVRQFLDVDRVLIYRFQPDQRRVVVAESVASPWPSTLGFEMPEPYFAELAYHLPDRGQAEADGVAAVDDVHTADLQPCHRSLLAQLSVQAKLMIPLWQGDRLWGMMVAHHCRSPRQWQPFDRGCFLQLAAQLEIAIYQSELYCQLEQANRELEQLATQDGLTHIANRRTFNRVLALEWERMQREQQPLSLLLIDVDHFKRYNDYYGHQAGDHCLCQVAQVLTQVAQRPADLVARYGGEEFALLLPQTTPEGAVYVARTIQSTLQALALEHHASPVARWVTVSIGLSTVVPTDSLSIDQWVYQTDQALYAAKAQGRNGYFQTS